MKTSARLFRALGSSLAVLFCLFLALSLSHSLTGCAAPGDTRTELAQSLDFVQAALIVVEAEEPEAAPYVSLALQAVSDAIRANSIAGLIPSLRTIGDEYIAKIQADPDLDEEDKDKKLRRAVMFSKLADLLLARIVGPPVPSPEPVPAPAPVVTE